MFVPRVKHEKVSNKRELKLPIKIFFADKTASFIENAIPELMPFLKFKVVSEAAKADFLFETRPGISDLAEYYEIKSENARLHAFAKDARGHFGALATIAQIISLENEKFYIKDAEIKDYPDKPYRSFMIDTGRKYVPIPEFKAQILMLAKAKLNKLHWHLFDAEGYSIAFDSYNKLNSPDKSGIKYSKDEVRELIAYADSFGIDIIPEIDMPGHSFGLTAAYPELLCDTESSEPHGWTICMSHEESYDYARAIFSEVAELFPYEYIHVGTDELDMRDIFNKRFSRWQYQDWDRCKSCLALSKKLGLKSTTDRFYYFLRRIYEIVTSLGKKMMMWNDNIDISTSPDIPRDILIEFWRVAEKNRGPRDGCSMQRFIDEGFEVINADYPMTYIDLPEYLTWEKLKAWDLTSHPADAKEKSYQILGAETCAWDVRLHWDYSLYTVVPAFADRCYNLAPISDEEEFKVALTRLALGIATPIGLNIFGTYVKDIVMTENTEEILAPNCNKEEFKSILKSLKKQNAAERALTAAYIKRI